VSLCQKSKSVTLKPIIINMMEHYSTGTFRPSTPPHDVISNMMEETVDARYFENLQRDAGDLLSRMESNRAEDAQVFLYSDAEIEKLLEFSGGEPIGTISRRFSKQAIDCHLETISDLQKQMWMQEYDEQIDEKVVRSATPPSAPLARQAESIERFGGEDDCGWKFDTAAGVQLTARHLYDDSASNRTLTDSTSSLPPPPPAAIAFAPRQEQIVDRTEAYEVFFRCKVVEILQREELEKTIATRMTTRLRDEIQKLNRGKLHSLQVAFDHSQHTTEESKVILKRISKISTTVATESLRNNPYQVVMSRNLTKCEECKKEFGIIVRRHHCRRCGRCLCNECCCCLGTLPINNDPSNNSAVRVPEPERLCGVCYDTCLKAQQSFTDEKEAKFFCQEKAVLPDGLPRFYAIPPNDYAAALSPAFAKIALDKATEGTVSLVTTGAEYCASVFGHWAAFVQAQISQQPQQQQNLIENRHTP
jgi:hypothetical protein